MNISISHKPFSTTDSDTLVFFAWKKDADSKEICNSKQLKEIDDACGGIIARTAQIEQFDPSVGKTIVVQTHGKIPSRNVLLVGLGVKKEISVASLQKSGAIAARKLNTSKSSQADIYVDTECISTVRSELVYQSISEGIHLGSYHFTRHKSDDTESQDTVKRVSFVVSEDESEKNRNAIDLACITSGAVAYTRNLVNEPPSLTTPSFLAKTAQDIVKDKRNMSCEVFGKDELVRLKMGGILGIARGTDVEPKFIKIEYTGGGDKTIALIGKGITFDTGGLSLKSSEAMETMKMDMAGAAAVLGVFSALDSLRPKINVVGLISATENMPGPNAIKPGDVVTAMNGKTIEVLNTDAEGRVVLADALSYAVSRIKPDVMIDLATLTGACIVALGEEVSGLFANNDLLADQLLEAATNSGELLWRMPLIKEYTQHIKSRVADVKNIGNGRWGGAITAALFLQEFTDLSIPWAHLDIAGPAFAEKDMIISPYGGTGYGVRLLLQYLLERG